MFKRIHKIYLGTKRAYSILETKKDKRMLVLLWGLMLSTYIVAMIQPTALMLITDGTASLLTERPKYFLLFCGVAVLVIGILLGFYSRLKGSLWARNVKNIISDAVTLDLIDKSAKLKYQYFEDNKIYDKISLVISNAPDRISNLMLSGAIPSLLGAGISLIYTAVLLFKVNPLIALGITLGNILTIFFYYKRTKDNYRLKLSQIPQGRWAGAYWDPLVSRECLKEVKVFGLTDYLLTKWTYFTNKTIRENYKLTFRYSFILFAADFISILFKIASLCLVVYMITEETASIGVFMLVYGSISLFAGHLSDLSNIFIEIGNNAEYISEWLEFMQFKEEQTNEINLKKCEELNIIFKDVKFKYPNSDRYVIDGINLDIRQGEHIAIVGENGSGKSTFVSLLCGFFDDFEGEILVNGIDIRENIALLRRKLVGVYQDFCSYEFTVRENILFGDLFEKKSEEDIYKAARKAGADTFIDLLPEKMNTNIGTYKEKGHNLSGGQWQKIAIARALLRENAKMIILDEPTASLDPYAESVIYKEFSEKIQNKTSILISHRLGATMFSDKILVFHEGKIVEVGSHKQLMNQRGMYYNMYTTQSKWYT